MSDYLGAKWRKYQLKVTPRVCPECQRAFYAGAQALMDIAMSGRPPSEEETIDDVQADVRLMYDLETELKDFAKVRVPHD